MIPRLVLSLDFELFWGVSASRTVQGYRDNILGEWDAIPRMLALFRRRCVKATWATVGMLMCRNYAQWREMRPAVLPGYKNQRCSTYALEAEARENPKMFFGRPLVEEILQTPGQELAGHSYSHFYCKEPGATTEQFAADLACAREIAAELGISYQSFVFPRNQVDSECMSVLADEGYQVFRGNPPHPLYDQGHKVAGGKLIRGVRLADAYLPLSGSNAVEPVRTACLVNCQASFFLRPWSRQLAVLDTVRLWRLKGAMSHAAEMGKVFHLWWHPHNFGMNTDQNLAFLESVLDHYDVMRARHGMQSATMADVVTGGCSL
jgi:peptidoglycan/xylan/chitin deacetylase (PgdA/CDA1 family)